MQKFSRNMPPRPPDRIISGWVLLSVILALAGVAFVLSRVTFWILLGCLAVLVPVSVWLNRRTTSQLRRLAEAREQDSICTFSRSFRRHHVDPWIIRAVYEEIQAYLAVDVKTFPIRATDRPDDLHIDPEDLEFMVIDIARRVGRSTSGWELNPMNARAQTIGDLVLLLNHQPRIHAA